MTKYSKIAKSSFAIILLSLVLVALLAFGGTYAYFTASVEASGSVTTGTLSLNNKTAEVTLTLTDTKIVPNETIDLTSELAEITLEGNTVSALRITLGDVEITDSEDAPFTDTEGYVKLSLTDSNTTKVWKLNEEDDEDKAYYYTNLVVGTANTVDSLTSIEVDSLEDVLSNVAVGISLDKKAGNTYQNLTVSFTIKIEAVQAEYHEGFSYTEGTTTTITPAQAAGLNWTNNFS